MAAKKKQDEKKNQDTTEKDAQETTATADATASAEKSAGLTDGNSGATATDAAASSPESTDQLSEQEQQLKVNYSVSGGLRERLSQLNVSIVFTSYQTGLIYLIGQRPEGGISIHHTQVPKPMGVCLDADVGGFMVAGDFQIFRFANVLNPGELANQVFDACYVPRRTYLTGRLDAHDIGINGKGMPVFVNTRYNCLATVSDRDSFVPLWRPSFISSYVDEDRCHINGLAMEDGEPRYVTVVSRSNTIDGWRDRRIDGGAVVDVKTGEIIASGLSMPHSPRLYDGKLWILNSGTGDLGFIHLDGKRKGEFETLVFCPGFVRGLAFRNGFAFVGLSKPRYQRFEGLELDDKLKEADSDPWCGVQVIELATRTCVDWMRIDGQVAELYDVDLLPGPTCPMAVSANSSEAVLLTKFTNPDQPVAQETVQETAPAE